MDVITFHLHTFGLIMKHKREHLSLHYRVCYMITNRLNPFVIHGRKQGESVVMHTYFSNQYIHVFTISWKELSAPKRWLIDMAPVQNDF